MPETAFHYWRRELKRPSGAGAKRGGQAAPLFLPVRVTEGAAGSGAGIADPAATWPLWPPAPVR